ncbi:MAG: hypothetical protein JNM76_16740 [Betaproteobacteria bacterium]|nr:hypothetical protein [Betaproteobacteria bacterium]
MKRSLILAGFALPFLTACASLPESGKPAEVTGMLSDAVVANRSATQILTVDGKSVEGKVVTIQSGKRTLTFHSLPIPGHRGGERKALELAVKPCTRYYINAQRKNPEAMDWDAVIGKEEPMAGCK